jgi:hypothetical protein
MKPSKDGESKFDSCDDERGAAFGRERILQRLMDLRWQRDLLQQWSSSSKLPLESTAQLQEMFLEVDSELKALEAAQAEDGTSNRRKTG